MLQTGCLKKILEAPVYKLSNMNQNTNIYLTVEAWADIVIDKWVKKSKELEIKQGSGLELNRFYHFITTQADGDPRKIEFTFDYYLKFVNWGVGRGVNLKDRDTYILSKKKGKNQKGEGRRPRPWYDDVFYNQLSILGHLMAEKYGQKTVALIKTTIESANSDGTKSEPQQSPQSSARSNSSSNSRKVTPNEFRKKRKELGW